MDNATLATDEVVRCPGCDFCASDDTPFATCPRCGLIISKYRLRHQPPTVPEKEPADCQTSVPDSGPIDVGRPGMVGALLHGGLHRLTLIFLLLLATSFLAVKYAVPLMQADHKKAVQERELKLFQAVIRGDQGTVRRLLLTGVNPNAIHKGHTLLEIALNKDEIEVAETLIDGGASLSFGGRTANGAFLREVNRNNMKGALFLLRHGADANASFYGDFNALCSAAAHGNTEFVLALLGHGANINFVGEKGNTPLISAAYSQRLEVMKLLLQRGVNVSPRNSAGDTPLRIAKTKRNAEMITLLTNAGAIE